MPSETATPPPDHPPSEPAVLPLMLHDDKVTVPPATKTPPPSLLYRRSLNTFAADYTREINTQSESKQHAVWDLFSIFGGLYGVNRNYRQGLMSGDKVHYSKTGYEKQGTLFTEALLQAYENYKTNLKN